MLKWILVAITLWLTAMPVLASGSGIVRDLSSTSFRACPKDAKLKEHYYVAADAYDYDEVILIACLRDSTSAVWVFRAAEGCGQPSCDAQLASPTEHVVRNDPDASPPVVTYESVGFEAGEDCVIDKTHPVWSCRSHRRHPNTPFKVTATGSTHVVADIKEGAANLPLAIRRSGAERAAH